MVGGAAVQCRRLGEKIHHIAQEGGQLECLLRQSFGLRQQIRIVLEQMRQMPAQHAGTGTRRNHHIIIGGERR
jgi:hypothetical protein